MRTTEAKPRRNAKGNEKRGAAVRVYSETSVMSTAAQVSPDKPLTSKQKEFVKFWASGETIPNAMAKAGYNDQPSYGYRMAKMPNILALYHEEQAKYAEASQMTRKKVIDMHLEAFEMARTIAEPSSMVSAAREIGKICGLYEPQKIEVSSTVKHEIHRFEGMSDEELLRIITEGQNPALESPNDDEYSDAG